MYFLAALVDEGFASNLINRLMVGIIPALVLVVLFTIALNVASKRRKIRSTAHVMFDADNKANSTRAKKIDDELFFVVDLNALPIKEYSLKESEAPHPTYMWQKKVSDTYQKKMLHFEKKYTNIELKEMFGQANIEFVARYEENFTNFNHTLINWAKALQTHDNHSDAQKILEYAVSIDSEISAAYTLLADIYAGQNNLKALQQLHEKAEQSTMPHKTPTLSHIQELIVQN